MRSIFCVYSDIELFVQIFTTGNIIAKRLNCEVTGLLGNTNFSLHSMFVEFGSFVRNLILTVKRAYTRVSRCSRRVVNLSACFLLTYNCIKLNDCHLTCYLKIDTGVRGRANERETCKITTTTSIEVYNVCVSKYFFSLLSPLYCHKSNV